MRVRTLLPFLFLFAIACQDSLPPAGEPNIRVVDGNSVSSDPDVDPYASSFFFFRSPIVPEPPSFNGTFSPYLETTIEIWSLGEYVNEEFEKLHRDDVYAVWDESGIDPSGYGCYGQLRATYSGADISVDEYTETYSLGWNTDDDLTEADLGYVFRVCVSVTDPFENSEILLGYRDVSPDASGADIPRDGAELPIYQFNLGRNLPIKYWVGGGALCRDAEGRVIDCTTVTLDANGGTATCDEGQCGIYVPQGAIDAGETATFQVRYIACDAYYPDNTVEYLDIDIPQYFGCLEVETVASYDWAAYDGLGPGITIAACRDQNLLGPQDERLLMHIESKADNDGDGRLDVFALPTRPFDLDCSQSSQPELAANASLGEKARYYVARGTRALQRSLLPWIDPPTLTAAHSGFGGGTSLKCDGLNSAGADGPNAVAGCSAPILVSGGGVPALTEVPAGEVAQYRAVWALPSKIAERLQVVYDESNTPSTIPWVDPVSGSLNGTLYPAVYVTDECKPDPDPFLMPDGTLHYETCSDPGDEPRPVEGAIVSFEFFDADGNPYLSVPNVPTNEDGIALAGWPLPELGTFKATAGGLGIGVDQSLLNYAYDPAQAGTGSFQDHVGNVAVQLETGLVQFEANVCTDKSGVLATQYVDAEYGAGIAIPINVSKSDADTAYLYVTNDCYNIYFALEIPQSEDLQNSLRVVFVDQLETRFQGTFDPNSPTQFAAVPDVGDDMWFISRDADKKSPTFGQWLIDDWHVSDDCTGSSKQSECGTSDPAQNLHAPNGAVYAPEDNPTATVYEFARCFPGSEGCVEDPDGYDFAVPDIGGSTWIGFYLVLQGGKGAQGNTEYPDFRIFQPIEIVRQ